MGFVLGFLFGGAVVFFFYNQIATPILGFIDGIKDKFGSKETEVVTWEDGPEVETEVEVETEEDK